MKKLILLILLIFLPYLSIQAAQDIYTFHSESEQKRFTILTSQLRCLVCQNQNLAESNSGLASDLREQIYEKIIQGKSDSDIVNYLVTRYGNFILYRPPLILSTIGLWVSPFLILIIGIFFLFRYILREN